MNDKTKSQLIKESIFIIGSVSSVSGRTVKIKVNKNKNTSHLLFNGDVLKNVSVNGYIKITKGFKSIIGKVEGEYIETKKIDKEISEIYNKEEDFIERFLEVSLFGSFAGDKFEQGIKEMPLIGNECYLLNKKEFTKLHEFHKKGEKVINIGKLSDEPSQEIKVSINQLFASHIGIFGNTGSGKSNTLAKLYYELFNSMRSDDGFNTRSKFIIIDFNGEYGKSGDGVITENKKVYNLSTRKEKGEDQIPLEEKALIDIELISILANATEKTQKPFIERTINLYKKIHKKSSRNEQLEYFKNSLKSQLKKIMLMSIKEKAYTLLDYYEQILNNNDEPTSRPEWQNTLKYFIGSNGGAFLESDTEGLDIFLKINNYKFPTNSISKLIHFLYLQIIYDIFNNKAQEDHISPAINKLKSRQKDIEKIFKTTSSDNELFEKGKNMIVINLKDTNTEMKKTIPLLICKRIYDNHKINDNFDKESLHIIIDEAHNILSDNSERESESWKDYRLETFEEIIKEGRKFNTFLTISSQRPHDISTTIISQLHNYFIHKLINDFDINAIHKTVAYLDKLSFESIPILSTGNCFFAGVSTNLPVKVEIDLLEKENQPNSETVNLESIWKLGKKEEIEEKLEDKKDDDISVEDLPF